jgi:Dyp-type peroxidase family
VSTLDLRDVQGMLRFGYKHMTEARYDLLRVKNVAAARAWLRTVPVTSAVKVQPLPQTALNVAFTVDGLRALGVPARVLAGFSDEFLAGMVQENRSLRLGDTGTNAPSLWMWGAGACVPHLVLMVFAEPGRLDDAMRCGMGDAGNDAFEMLTSLDTSDLHGFEQFGFTDGVSQPTLDWSQERRLSGNQVAYENLVALGEFLLGYRNEYNKYTDRPLIDPDIASADLLVAEDAPEKKDVARNGSYLVMRHLRQDVRGFWRYVERQSIEYGVNAEALAAAFVGRMKNGDALVPVREQAVPGVSPDFTYDADPKGVLCPFGAHIRRANPRNADYPGTPGWFARLIAMLGSRSKNFRDDLISSVRFHRILRRGREYGPGLSAAEALAPAPPYDPERGLRFVCLNANISRQFEFLQNAWMMNSTFNGMSDENDPLLGNRTISISCPITGDFTVPTGDGLPRRARGLPSFITVRGGAYFFLPSIRALRYFAAVKT